MQFVVNITRHNRDADSVRSASLCTGRLTVPAINCCVSQDAEPPKSKSIFTERHKILGTEAQRAILKRFITPRKNRERKGPSQGVTQNSDPRERTLRAPKFEDRSEEETLKQATSPLAFGRFWCLPAPSLTKPEERFWRGSGCTCWAGKVWTQPNWRLPFASK